MYVNFRQELFTSFLYKYDFVNYYLQRSSFVRIRSPIVAYTIPHVHSIALSAVLNYCDNWHHEIMKSFCM
jgi:hypothetical protein